MGSLHTTQIYYNKPVSKFLKIMQFKSENEETLIDYYETKDVHNEIHDKVRLRVITFLGKTIEKKPINVYDMAEEIDILLEKIMRLQLIQNDLPSSYRSGHLKKWHNQGLLSNIIHYTKYIQTKFQNYVQRKKSNSTK